MMQRVFCLITILTILLTASFDVYSQELKDIKPPVLLPTDYLPFIIFLIVIIITVLTIIFLKIFKKKLKEGPVTTAKKSSADMAYERLYRLLKKELAKQGRIEEHFTALADIIRQYIEDQFSIKAPERTTQEFLEEIRNDTSFKNEHKELLREFLICCDLIKFAKFGPSKQQIEEGAGLVKQFIDETKPQVASEAKG